MRTWQQRLLAKYDVDEQGCWIWNRGTCGQGYGKLKRDGAYVSSHRLSYEHHKGEIPKGMLVCHTCDVRACINPEHLFLGTMSDNMRDCSQKGRSGGGGGGSPRLSASEKGEICQRVSCGESKRAVARSIGVSQGAITYWVNRKEQPNDRPL